MAARGVLRKTLFPVRDIAYFIFENIHHHGLREFQMNHSFKPLERKRKL